eukprot:352309-Chlamydomonas_euryale.AAC.5
MGRGVRLTACTRSRDPLRRMVARVHPRACMHAGSLGCMGVAWLHAASLGGMLHCLAACYVAWQYGCPWLHGRTGLHDALLGCMRNCLAACSVAWLHVQSLGCMRSRFRLAARVLVGCVCNRLAARASLACMRSRLAACVHGPRAECVHVHGAQALGELKLTTEFQELRALTWEEMRDGVAEGGSRREPE